jgi:hypothetical protein
VLHQTARRLRRQSVPLDLVHPIGVVEHGFTACQYDAVRPGCRFPLQELHRVPRVGDGLEIVHDDQATLVAIEGAEPVPEGLGDPHRSQVGR